MRQQQQIRHLQEQLEMVTSKLQATAQDNALRTTTR